MLRHSNLFPGRCCWAVSHLLPAWCWGEKWPMPKPMQRISWGKITKFNHGKWRVERWKRTYQQEEGGIKNHRNSVASNYFVFKSFKFARWAINLLYFRASVMRPPIGIQTDRRIREFLFDLSINLFVYKVLVREIDRNIKIKFRTNAEIKFAIVLMGLSIHE